MRRSRAIREDLLASGDGVLSDRSAGKGSCPHKAVTHVEQLLRMEGSPRPTGGVGPAANLDRRERTLRRRTAAARPPASRATAPPRRAAQGGDPRGAHAPAGGVPRTAWRGGARSHNRAEFALVGAALFFCSFAAFFAFFVRRVCARWFRAFFQYCSFAAPLFPEFGECDARRAAARAVFVLYRPACLCGHASGGLLDSALQSDGLFFVTVAG